MRLMNKELLKDFIIKNKDLIDDYQVKAVYDNAFDSFSNPVNYMTFSYICNGWIRLGLNPLEKMEFVPNYYTAYIITPEIIVPPNIEEIGSRAFDGAKLDTVIIDSGVKYISNYAFNNCEINSVIIKSSNISITNYAFLGAKIKQLVVPRSINFGISWYEQIQNANAIDRVIFVD